ncbi:transcriptional regulator BetI [Thalassotalea sp. ND16A]|uniref:transcriptional regulator BetI n=1 Tax=Thalassotalea sp. ND16A TaxID=1535422 RepID=UPI00051A5010|nr:transcriptional regulator BetI [Thalassotalea sp. ND16A]KGJ94784.1 putative transcriptional regulator, TetR family [Thalassotalea sp. ND16A]
MPKVGMEPLRRQQLIDATLSSISEHGLQNTTIVTISRIAGMSSGIISHYFGGKRELIEATVSYLLEQLLQSFLERITQENPAPQIRLHLIVESNFTEFQRSVLATKTWLSFWAKAMHDPAMARLQSINSKRLYSNLLFSFRELLEPEAAANAAKQTAAMIDGFWLRSALSDNPEQEFIAAELLCKTFINDVIKQERFNASNQI